MKQDPFANAYRALTPKELAEMLMNPNASKTEAEHWAVREIEKQRVEIERLREALTSIASNTCCGGCQEAARVARKALEAKP